MSEESNKKIFQRLIDEGFNQGNLAVLDEICAPNFVEHQDGIMPPTVDGLKGAITFLRNPFPDLYLSIEEIIGKDDKTWARITARGTHKNAFTGRPATGKSFTINVIDICRYENDKIVEHWGVADRLSQIAQLGLLTPR